MTSVHSVKRGVSGQTSGAVLTLVSTQLNFSQGLQVGIVGKLIKGLSYMYTTRSAFKVNACVIVESPCQYTQLNSKLQV